MQYKANSQTFLLSTGSCCAIHRHNQNNIIFSLRVQIPPESEDVDEEWSINHLKKHRIFCASHVRSFAENVSIRSSCLKRRISIRRSPNWLKEFYKGEWRKYFAFNKGEHGLIAQQEENGSNVFEDSTVSSKLNPKTALRNIPAFLKVNNIVGTFHCSIRSLKCAFYDECLQPFGIGRDTRQKMTI